jgi:hypothetical protein
MSFIESIKHTNAVKSMLIGEFSSIDKNLGIGNTWLFNPTGDGQDIFIESIYGHSSLKAYRRCPPLAAIVNSKAQAFVNGKTFILNSQGKAKDKEAQGAIATKIRNLFNKPNPLQSQKQFEAQLYTYLHLSAFCVMLPLKPVGFTNADVTTMWLVPPWMLDIKEKLNVNFLTAKSIKDLVERVTVVYHGERTDLPLDDIFIFKDFTPAVNSVVFPESKVVSHERIINNLIGIYESEGVIINKRGPSIVISSGKTDDSGVISLKPSEKDQLEKEFMDRFGLRRNQSRAIITAAPIKMDTFGFPTKELMLLEMAEDMIMRLCDGFGYYFQLLANIRSNALGGNNADPFKKLLYQDKIVPEAESIYEQWASFFSVEEYGLIIQKDYRHIPSMQEDQINEATARWRRNQAALIEFQNNLITMDEWRLLNNDDPINGELGSLYYYQLVAKGIVFGQGVSGASIPDNAAGGNNNTNQNGN